MKKIKFFLLLLIILVIASCLPQNQTQNTNHELQDSDKQEAITYTLEQVSAHNTADDCWIVLSGKVYDFTDYINNSSHPGGKTILQGCGQDATELFETRPMGSGTAHSQRARSSHDQYFIGNLQ